MRRYFGTSVVAALLLLTAGCGGGKTGAVQATEKKLVGTWEEKKEGGESLVFTLNEDHSLSMTYNTGAMGILTPTVVLVSGTWKVSGENVVLTYTHSTYANDKIVGRVDTEKLIQVDDHSFTAVDHKGKATRYTRKR